MLDHGSLWGECSTRDLSVPGFPGRLSECGSAAIRISACLIRLGDGSAYSHESYSGFSVDLAFAIGRWLSYEKFDFGPIKAAPMAPVIV